MQVCALGTHLNSPERRVRFFCYAWVILFRVFTPALRAMTADRIRYEGERRGNGKEFGGPSTRSCIVMQGGCMRQRPHRLIEPMFIWGREVGDYFSGLIERRSVENLTPF